MRSDNATRNSKLNSRPSIINRDHTREGLAHHVTDHHPETLTCTAQRTVGDTVMVMEVAISARDVQIILRCLSLVRLRVVSFWVIYCSDSLDPIYEMNRSVVYLTVIYASWYTI
jgi:hypothetical protein